MNDVTIVVRGKNETSSTFNDVKRSALSMVTDVKNAFTSLDKPMNVAGIAAGGAFAVGLAGAVGGGVAALGLGAFLLREQPEVVAAATELATTAKTVFTEAAKPLAQPFRTALLDISAAVQSMAPQLEQTFAGVAGFVQPLTDGIIGLVRNVLPGFNSMLHNLQPVFEALSDALPEIGDAIGNVFEAIGDSAPAIAQILGATLGTVTFMINLLAEVIELLGPLAPAILTAVAAYKALTTVIELATLAQKALALSMVATPWGAIAAGALGLGYALGALIDHLTTTEDSAEGAGRESKIFSQILSDLNSETVQQFADMVNYNNAIERMIENTQKASRASIDWEESIDDLSESLKENGRTLDITNEKGRANARAFLSAADAAWDKRAADIQSGASAASANKTYQTQIDRLYAIGRSAGIAEKELNELVGQYNVNVRFRTILTGPLAGLPGVAGLLASGIANAIPQKATGGIAGGWTIVGERGRELVKLPQGSMVYPSGQSETMVSKGSGSTGSGGGTRILVSAAPGASEALLNGILEYLKFEVAADGGDVQHFLGRN